MKRIMLGVVLLLFCIQFVTNVEHHGVYEEVLGFVGNGSIDQFSERANQYNLKQSDTEASESLIKDSFEDPVDILSADSLIAASMVAENYVEGEKVYLNENGATTLLPGANESTADPFYQDDFWNFTTVDKALQAETSTEETIKVNLTEKASETFSEESNASDNGFSKTLKFSKELRRLSKHLISPVIRCLSKNWKGDFIVDKPPCVKYAEKDLSDKKITQELDEEIQILSTDPPQVEYREERESVNPKGRFGNIEFSSIDLSSLSVEAIEKSALLIAISILSFLIGLISQYCSSRSKKRCNKCKLDFPQCLSRRDTRIQESDLHRIYSEAGVEAKDFLNEANCVSCALGRLMHAYREKFKVNRIERVG